MNYVDVAIYIALFLLAAAVTVVCIKPVKKLARITDAIDYPSGRRVNKVPIPRLGGIAIYAGITAAILASWLLSVSGVWKNPLTEHPLLNVNYYQTAIGVTTIFLIGVVDDIYDLHPKVKLLGQVVAAGIVAYSGVVFTSIHNPFDADAWIHFGWFGYPLTVIYLVSFANIINLIDGLDGLASGITSISAATMLVFAIISGRPAAIVLCCALIGACLGFLKFNRHPASIFMGDSGALLLGFMLGIISLFVLARAALFTSLLVPLLAAGVPIIDTLSAIVRRIRSHQPIEQADRGHIHHRLLDQGHDQKETVRIMLAWTVLLSLGGIVLTVLNDWTRLAVFAILAGISFMAIKRLGLFQPVLEHKYNPRISRRHIKDGTFTEEDKFSSLNMANISIETDFMENVHEGNSEDEGVALNASIEGDAE